MQKYMFYIDSMVKGGANRVMANLTDYFCNIGKEVVLINDCRLEETQYEYSVNGGVKRLILGNECKFRIFSNVKRILLLRRIIKTENPDVVVSFMGPPNIRMLIAALGLNCKKVVSVRNDPKIEYGSNRIARFIKCNIFKLADGCVFQTKEAMEYFPKAVQKKSRIIFNPVNKRFFNTQRTNEPKNIVTVGRFYEQKNHSLLIRSFARIAESIPDDNLIIYGDGIKREEMERMIAHLGLSDRIFLPGIVENVEEKLAEAKLFVLSSDYEGMPNVLMEAMAMGLPVISTDCPCGGPRALIEDEAQGILVPIKDEIALSNQMMRLVKNEDIRKEMSAATRQRAEAFESDVVFQAWEDYLEEV